MAYTSGMMNKRVTVAKRAADAASGYGKGAGGVRYSILGEFWAAEDYNKGVKSLTDNQTVFTIYDYEIRRDKDGRANWLKCLIGFNEVIDGVETGKIAAREFHGNYSCLVEAMELWEYTFGREQMLPIEEVTLENQCGYIFTNSTNQIKYIGNDYRQSDCA